MQKRWHYQWQYSFFKWYIMSIKCLITFDIGQSIPPPWRIWIMIWFKKNIDFLASFYGFWLYLCFRSPMSYVFILCHQAPIAHLMQEISLLLWCLLMVLVLHYQLSCLIQPELNKQIDICIGTNIVHTCLNTENKDNCILKKNNFIYNVSKNTHKTCINSIFIMKLSIPKY